MTEPNSPCQPWPRPRGTLETPERPQTREAAGPTPATVHAGHRPRRPEPGLLQWAGSHKVLPVASDPAYGDYDPVRDLQARGTPKANMG